MKRLLFLLFVSFGFLSAKAQSPDYNADRFRNESHYRDSLMNLLRNFRKPGLSNLAPSRPLLVQKEKRERVTTLPQDNMPCIVPDTKDIAAIPNFWKGDTKSPYKAPAPQMPNTTPQLPGGTTK